MSDSRKYLEEIVKNGGVPTDSRVMVAFGLLVIDVLWGFVVAIRGPQYASEAEVLEMFEGTELEVDEEDDDPAPRVERTVDANFEDLPF